MGSVAETILERLMSIEAKLDQAIGLLTAQRPQDPLISLSELQTHLPRGMKSRSAINRLINEGLIRHHRVGPRSPILFYLSEVLEDLDAFKAGGDVPALKMNRPSSKRRP